jgi:hypothetical protein
VCILLIEFETFTSTLHSRYGSISSGIMGAGSYLLLFFFLVTPEERCMLVQARKGAFGLMSGRDVGCLWFVFFEKNEEEKK